MATSALVIRDVRPELDDARVSAELTRRLFTDASRGTTALVALTAAGAALFAILHLGTGAFVVDLSMGRAALAFPVAPAALFTVALLALVARLVLVRRAAGRDDAGARKMRYFWASAVAASSFGAALALSQPHVPGDLTIAVPIAAALFGVSVVAASSAELLFAITELVLATSGFLTAARVADLELSSAGNTLVVTAEAALVLLCWLLHREKRARARLDLEGRELLTDLVTARERTADAEATAEEERALRVEIVARTTTETRTPLNGMLGMTDLLLAGTLRMEERFFAEQARSASEELLAILDDIRDLARLDAGDVAHDERPFDLEALLADVMTPFGALAAKRGTSLVHHRARGVPRDVVGDRELLRRVLTSLVSAALTRATGGDVVLTIEPKGELFEITLRDPGTPTGAPPLGLVLAKHLVEHLGSKLHMERGHGTVTSFALRLTPGDAKVRPRLLEGTNVALLVASDVRRRQVEAWLDEHGARLERAASLAELSQRITDGTRLAFVDGNTSMNFDAFASAMPTLRLFVLDAPKSTVEHHGLRRLASPLTLSDVERALRGEETEDLKARVVPRPSYGQARVLVVEDEPLDRAVLRGMLGRCGIQPRLAEDGAGALEAMLDERFDLVLIDAELRDVDAAMLTRRIREREDARGDEPQVIVALAEHGSTERRDRWLDAGMMDVLAKPLTLEAVEATLSRWLPRALFQRAARRFEEKIVRPRGA
ncbi:response regulator [Myxococcota bacterium]|nr:response regulator [Myxococcota bacterium]